jgi:hypothetical protein
MDKLLTQDELIAEIPDHTKEIVYFIDYPVGVIENDDGDGIAVQVPGPAWVDEYLSLRCHEEGTEIWESASDDIRDSVCVQITLDQAEELKLLIDDAVDILRQRRERRASQET